MRKNHLTSLILIVYIINLSILTTPRYISHEPTPIPKPQVVSVRNVQLNQVQISRGGAVTSKTPDEHATINAYIRDIASRYNIQPELVMSIIQHESRYNPRAKNGNCVGLMQVSMRWHSDRAARLGVTDFYDPYGNILIGVDYIAELFAKYKDPRLVLMLYNMKHNDAIKSYNKGEISGYAKSVLAKAEVYKKGV